MKIHQIYRLHKSTYHKKDFISQEKKRLEKENLIYVENYQDLNPHLPLILITHTQFNVRRFIQEHSNIFEITKCIVHPNSGMENIPIELIQEKGIKFYQGSCIRTQAVSEYILACLCQWNTPIPQRNEWDVNRTFRRQLFMERKGLILGWGNIGKMMENILRSLNIQLDILDPFLDKKPAQFLKKQYDFILCCADSRHSPTYSNHGFINAEYFNLINEYGAFINTSRGELVDWPSMLNFAQKFPLARLFLDVFPNEPYDFNQLSSYPNITLTSHIAGVYNSIDERISAFISESIDHFMQLC